MEQSPSQPDETPLAGEPASKPVPVGAATSPEKRRRRPPSSVWTKARRSAIVGAVGVAAAAIAEVLGIAHLPWFWLLLEGGLIAAIAFCTAQALSARTVALKTWWWRTDLLVALLLLLGVFGYHHLLDPTTRGPRTYQFVANGTEVNVIPLFGEAGGAPQTIETGSLGQNGLIGGQTYEFDCWVIGSDSAEWLKYRRFGQTWYAPRGYLHWPVGVAQPNLPHC